MDLSMLTSKLSRNFIDWCYNCVGPIIKDDKKKMFAWMALYTLKQLPKQSCRFVQTQNSILLYVDISYIAANDALKNLAYNKKYWSFITHLLSVYLDNLDIQELTISKNLILSEKDKRLTVTFIPKDSK